MPNNLPEQSAQKTPSTVLVKVRYIIACFHAKYALKQQLNLVPGTFIPKQWPILRVEPFPSVMAVNWFQAICVVTVVMIMSPMGKQHSNVIPFTYV